MKPLELNKKYQYEYWSKQNNWIDSLIQNIKAQLIISSTPNLYQVFVFGHIILKINNITGEILSMHRTKYDAN
jgi:hypothetical protein